MGALIIGKHERALIRATMARMHANIIPLATVVTDMRPYKPVVGHGERKPKKIATQFIVLPEGFGIVCAFEDQPAGLTLHLRISVAGADGMPSEPAVRMILEAFGVAGGQWDGVWVEEFLPGAHGVNVVKVVKPRTAGHA